MQLATNGKEFQKIAEIRNILIHNTNRRLPVNNGTNKLKSMETKFSILNYQLDKNKRTCG
jgi:hypothetical protein